MQPPGAAPSSPGLAAPPGLGRRARSGTVAVRPSTSSSTPPLAPFASSSTPPFSQSSSGLPGMVSVEAHRYEQRHVDAERDGEQDGESEEEHDPDEVQAASPTIQRFGTASLSPERVVSRQRERPGSARWSVEGGGLKRTRKKWLVLVVPPSSLPHDPPPEAVPGFAHGYGAPGRFEGGILMTLQPTLASQVSLIAREYGLPSVAGMCLYLALPAHSSSSTPTNLQYGTHSWSPHLSGPQAVDVGLKPRLTDEFWPALWSDFFQDDDGVRQGMVGASGLPIVGRVEFDFDPRRARWLDEWRARPLTTRAESLDVVPPLSPALSLRLERPLHRTSSSYVRPVTPSFSDIYVSESHTTGDDGNPSSSPRDGLSAPTTPRTSTPRTSFESHRPLSLVSQASARYQSQPRSASVTSARSSSEDVKDGIEVEATTPRAAVLPAHLVKSLINDSGFVEGTPFRVVERKPAASSPPEPSPITLTASGSTFAFPRPLPRSLSDISAASSSRESDALDTSAIPPDSDWTTQLDRLREISETSLVLGVDHPSHFGSVDTSANETLGEFLLSIVGEAAREAPARARGRYEEDFASGIYPMRGLYGLAQPPTALPLASASSVVCGPVAEPASSTTQDDLAPASTRSASCYPFVVLYPPVYPTFNLYPPPAASSSYTSTIRQPSPRTVPQPVALVLDDPSSWVNEPATPSGYVDDDPFASSSFAPDSPTSPVHGGSSDGLDDFLESYTHQGRPLSSITEVTENVTSGSTSRTWSGNFTPAVEAPSAPGGRFGELELEEGEDAQWATEPVALPQILLDAAAGPPRFTYSSPTASIEPSALEPVDLAHSPLPSPTIRPASALSASLPLIPPVPDQPHADDSDEELDDTAHDNDDEYTLDVTSTLSSTLDYSGSFDSPYLVSPGLQAALGLDDSPQLGPVLFGDEGEYEVHGAAGDSEEDSLSEDGSQYSGRRQSMRVDEDERDPGDQCLTLDRFTLSHFEPVLPVLFSFPSLSSSRELLDALAQFIVEAQVQSVDRRGSFRIALGGGALPELLSQALVLDERVEWDKWEIFFVSDSPSSTAADAVPVTQRFVDELFSRVPVGSGKVHVFFPGGKGTDVAQEYEDQLARVFEPDEGEVPRFDLILLGAADLGITTSTAASTSSAHWVTSLDSSDTSTRPAVALSPSILSATRRLAYLLPSTSSRDALVSVLAHDAPGNVQLSSRQPVVLFADEDAAGAVEWERARFWDAEDE
ncbi:hypothetical protein JCM9279_006286 [Rhodotorula babjevae]